MSAMHVTSNRFASPIGEMICDAGDLIPQMTAERLQQLGTRQVVYLSAGTCDDEIVFVIHGADGTPVVMVEDLVTAIALVAEHGLIVVAVH
jgi:hypothetical protein